MIGIQHGEGVWVHWLPFKTLKFTYVHKRQSVFDHLHICQFLTYALRLSVRLLMAGMTKGGGSKLPTGYCMLADKAGQIMQADLRHGL